MRRRLHALAWVGLLSGVFFASCLARRDKPFVRQTDDDAGAPDAIVLDGSLPDISPDALDIASRNDVRVTGMITEQRPGTVSAVQGDNLFNVAAPPAGGTK